MYISRPWRKHVQSFKEIGIKLWGVALTRYPLSIHFHRIWGQEMTKFAKWKNWQKLMQGLYPNHMHIFRPWRKHKQIFKKIGIKLYEDLRSQGTHCLLIEVKKWLSSQSGKSDNNLTIISKPHAHPHTMMKTRSVQNCKRSCAHKTPRVNVDWWTNGRTNGRTDERTDENLHA